jgi:hypothetical protein
MLASLKLDGKRINDATLNLAILDRSVCEFDATVKGRVSIVRV